MAYTFKSDFGESGLSGKLWEMEKNELDDYWRLYREGMIMLPLLTMLTIFSLVKYLRRVLITWAQHLIRFIKGS